MLKLRKVLEMLREVGSDERRLELARQFWTKGLRNFFVIQYHPDYKMNLPPGRFGFESKEVTTSLENFFRTVDSYVFATNALKIQKAFVRTLSMMEREDADLLLLAKDRLYDVGMNISQLKELDSEIWGRVSRIALPDAEVAASAAPVVTAVPQIAKESQFSSLAPPKEPEKPKQKLRGFAKKAYEKRMAKLASEGSQQD